ncbi:TetR/AcrR family transcriptional regulator [Amycolatopsis lurida]
MAQTGDRIAAAALRILLAEGAEAVTMRRVAAEVGVTPMATYRHFPNREALLRAVADAAFDELGKNWRPHAETVEFEERVELLLTDFLDFALGRPNLYKFLIIDRREPVRRFPEDFRDGLSPAFGAVWTAVEQGMREGALDEDDPLEVTLALTMPAVGLVQLYLGGRMNLSEPEFRALCARTTRRVLNGLRR